MQINSTDPTHLPWQADGMWPDQQQDFNKDETYYLSATASIFRGCHATPHEGALPYPSMATYFWL
jgi:hypothetical protein